MKIRRKNRVPALVVGVLLSACAPAWAASTFGEPPPPAPSPSRTDLILRKLGRGVANIATCPAELIRIPMLVERRDGYVAGMSVGIIQGVWRTLVRGTTGVLEVVTFYAEIPKGYEPLVKPEFVFAHGSWAE